MKPLRGKRIVSLATNLPGPAAAYRLQELGARVTKVEPPSGDPMAMYFPKYYRHLTKGQKILQLDLKNPDGQEKLGALLKNADLLLTSFRLKALRGLGLHWHQIHKKFSRLSQIALIGGGQRGKDFPGHDLNFQAEAGLVIPPHLPVSCVADHAASQEVVICALALVLGKKAQYCEVSLAQAAHDVSSTLQYGLTGEGTLLGGAEPSYGVYQTKTDWIALAALEPEFRATLEQKLNLRKLSHAALSKIFRTKPARYWEAWAEQNDLPLNAVKGETWKSKIKPSS